MNRKKILDILSAVLLEKADSLENEGLYDGLTGICLFLYEYSQASGKAEAGKKADELIERCWNKLSPDGSANFYEGKPGIIWGIEWLRQQGMLEWDITEPDINETDSIVIRQKYYTPVQIDVESDLFSAGFYLFGRYKAYQAFNEKNGNENTWLYEQFLREHLIYLVEECERIVFNRAYLQSLLLPCPSSQILCSVLYFITLAHKERIFPHKTSHIRASLPDILHQVPVNDVTEWATLRCLCGPAYEAPIPELSPEVDTKEMSSWIAKAGFHSLLYNDIKIFDTVTDYLSRQKKNEWMGTLEGLLETPQSYPPGMNGLAGWGHGLLNSTRLSKNH